MTDPGDSTCAFPASEPSASVGHRERLVVTVVREAGDWLAFPSLEAAIEAAAAALARHPRCEHARGAEATVVLADDSLVRALNRAYRGKDKATNVLSFPFQVPSAASSGLLGDVVLAEETISREATEYGIAPVHHLQHLIVHGLLHLLGFDHETDAEAEDMERLETEILAALGLADPHAAARNHVTGP